MENACYLARCNSVGRNFAKVPFKKMRKIDDLLKDGQKRHSSLGTLLRQAASQQHLTAIVRALLPESLGRGISGVSRHGPALRLHCDDGGIATRLRFQLPELLPELRVLADFADVERIDIRVVPRR
ncbi:MAG: DciA family protein [Pseudomonadota bacterium]